MALSEGCYLLRTNLTDVAAATLWNRYIQLTEAEWAFRITKDELQIRPIWHQKQERVLAHILVCFLAYVLWKALAQWMRRAGLGDAPRTLVEEFARIKSGDVVLPARWGDGTDRTVHLRCVTSPDEAQKVLLNRLGPTLPQRLRRIDELAQTESRLLPFDSLGATAEPDFASQRFNLGCTFLTPCGLPLRVWQVDRSAQGAYARSLDRGAISSVG